MYRLDIVASIGDITNKAFSNTLKHSLSRLKYEFDYKTACKVINFFFSNIDVVNKDEIDNELLEQIFDLHEKVLDYEIKRLTKVETLDELAEIIEEFDIIITK